MESMHYKKYYNRIATKIILCYNKHDMNPLDVYKRQGLRRLIQSPQSVWFDWQMRAFALRVHRSMMSASAGPPFYIKPYMASLLGRNKMLRHPVPSAGAFCTEHYAPGLIYCAGTSPTSEIICCPSSEYRKSNQAFTNSLSEPFL